MAKTMNTCTRVMSHHQAVSHIVGAVAVMFLVLYMFEGFHLQYFAFLPIPIIECMKGVLLLVAMFKESRRQILIYLVIHILTLVLKHLFLLFYTVLTVVPNSVSFLYAMLWIFALLLYLAYDWFMVYSVMKIRQSIQSASHEGDTQFEIHYKPCEDEGVDKITV